MASKKNAGLIVAIIGALIALVFGLADVLGIGSNPTRMGYQQIMGMVVGLSVFLVGLVMLTRKPQ